VIVVIINVDIFLVAEQSFLFLEKKKKYATNRAKEITQCSILKNFIYWITQKYLNLYSNEEFCLKLWTITQCMASPRVSRTRPKNFDVVIKTTVLHTNTLFLHLGKLRHTILLNFQYRFVMDLSSLSWLFSINPSFY
jgi:hypothetical protein